MPYFFWHYLKLFIGFVLHIDISRPLENLAGSVDFASSLFSENVSVNTKKS